MYEKLKRRRAVLFTKTGGIVAKLGRTNKWQWAGGSVLVTGAYGIIAYRLWREWSGLDLSRFRIHYSILAASWLAHATGTLVAIWIWAVLMRQMGHTMPLKRHISVYSTSNLVRRLPGFLWGVIGRAYLYHRDGVSKLETSVAALMEMLLMTTAALAIGVLSAQVSSELPQQVSLPTLLILLIVCIGGLHPRLGEILRRRFPKLGVLPLINWRCLMLILSGEVVVIILGGVSLYFLLAAVYPVRADVLLVAVRGWALSIVANAVLFWLPFDFGLGSGFLVLLLGGSIPMPVAVVLVIMWRCWIGLLELLWGLAGLLCSPSFEAFRGTRERKGTNVREVWK